MKMCENELRITLQCISTQWREKIREKKTHEEAKEEEKNAKLFKSRQTLARTPTIYYSEKYQWNSSLFFFFFCSKWPRDRFSLVQIHFSYSLLKFNDMENYAIRQIELRFFDRPTTHSTAQHWTLTYENAWILEHFGVLLVFYSPNIFEMCSKEYITA